MNNEVKIINGYDIKDAKAVRTYDTLALLKADRKLKQGQHVKTRGYYSNGDGGSAEYYITNTQSESEYQENLENGLYATLIIKDNTVNIKQVGSDINNIIDFDINKIVFEKDTYDIDDTIIINKKIELDFNGSTINYTGENYLFNITTKYNEKPILKNGVFIGLTTNNFISCNYNNEWGGSFDLIDSKIYQFNNIFNCYCNFNNRFENIDINSNGIFTFNGNDISNAIIFEKCYFKAYSQSDVYPDYKITMNNAKNILFLNCSFEQFKTLFNNTSCNNISIIACEFEQCDYLAKNNNGLNNVVYNNFFLDISSLFENEEIKTAPYTVLTSNYYRDSENNANTLRSKLRTKSNLRQVHSDVVTNNASSSVRLWNIQDKQWDIFVPLNVLRNEIKEVNTEFATSITPITSYQQDESFLFTVYNYMIGTGGDYQLWKSTWLQINHTNYLLVSQEKVKEATWSGSGLYENTITETMTNSTYTVTSTNSSTEKYTFILYQNLGNKIR